MGNAEGAGVIDPTTAKAQRHYARICLTECRARRRRPEQHQRDFAEVLLGWALKARRAAHSRHEPRQMELFA